MLDNKGFNLWADGYDKAVGISEEANTYPFAGYKSVLGGIFDEIMHKEEAGSAWDEDEIYFVIDELREAFPELVFEQKSYCSGIITIVKN